MDVESLHQACSAVICNLATREWSKSRELSQLVRTILWSTRWMLCIARYCGMSELYTIDLENMMALSTASVQMKTGLSWDLRTRVTWEVISNAMPSLTNPTRWLGVSRWQQHCRIFIQERSSWTRLLCEISWYTTENWSLQISASPSYFLETQIWIR